MLGGHLLRLLFAPLKCQFKLVCEHSIKYLSLSTYVIVHIQAVEVFAVTTNAVEGMTRSIRVVNCSIRQIVIAILTVVDAKDIITATLCALETVNISF